MENEYALIQQKYVGSIGQLVDEAVHSAKVMLIRCDIGRHVDKEKSGGYQGNSLITAKMKSRLCFVKLDVVNLYFGEIKRLKFINITHVYIY